MVVIVGCLIVCASVIGGFIWAGGHVGALIQPSEVLVIGGASGGALVIMSSPAVLKGLVKGIIQALKGDPYSKKTYEETFSALYELFRIARRDGLLALEGHIADPHKSAVFAKYPKLAADHHATEFIKGAFGPLKSMPWKKSIICPFTHYKQPQTDSPDLESWRRFLGSW
jgi:chemotaxis protein MotA